MLCPRILGAGMIDFVVNGRIVSAEELTRTAKPVAKKTTQGADNYHKGWRVAGHPPGSMETAKALADEAWLRWERKDEAQKAKAMRGGEKPPKPWDEAAWHLRAPLKAVRSKPYEVPEAADECRLLALKSGWMDVVVIEMKKGEAE